jgi:hypothetical protein
VRYPEIRGGGEVEALVMEISEERRQYLVTVVCVRIGIALLVRIGEERVPTHEDRVRKHDARCKESFVDDVQTRDDCCEDTKDDGDRAKESSNGTIRIILEESDKTNDGSNKTTKTKNKIE